LTTCAHHSAKSFGCEADLDLIWFVPHAAGLAHRTRTDPANVPILGRKKSSKLKTDGQLLRHSGKVFRRFGAWIRNQFGARKWSEGGPKP